MQKITNYCDGCSRKLEGVKLKEAQAVTTGFNKEFNRSETTIFCLERCNALALDYWEESANVVFQALSTASKTIENHRRKFFARTALKEVG